MQSRRRAGSRRRWLVFSCVFSSRLQECTIFSALKRKVFMGPQNRREFLAAAAAVPLILQGRGAQTTTPAAPRGAPAATGMFVSIHQASTAKYDFKTSCEGISKAGVRAVEVDIAKVQQFAMTESLPKAKQLLTDLGLRAVSSSNHLGFVDASAQQFPMLLDQLKTKLEVVQAVGC